MNKELQQLKDIHLPHAINMWPITPAWLILFALMTGLFIYIVYSLYKRRKKKNTVKFALTKLKSLEQLMAANPENINVAAELSTLLRRTALYYFNRKEIAGLAGDDWLNFLNKSGDMTQFTSESGRILIDAPYRKNNTTDLMPLIGLTRAWLVAISQKKPWSGEK